ncbi:LuxR C-terminal-related transcriptional regulator [Microbacterium rhizomatis]|uniref:HTH luxR-type domain-containing protein n=1 Tax=Microbacterium rhizomatis TaxID=1631477 RepID=A0A5J5J824_9MICO|nr:LuxR C-terminal-related transcriptional regulator [Microbacterium rhizomatis]KAA9111284.1 hypothetical protein F6B43_06760 [Microbacterium rhizomatis]
MTLADHLETPRAWSADSRCVVVLAPAGYGKTTLLRQWATDSGLPFLWVTRPVTAEASPDGLAVAILDAIGQRWPDAVPTTLPPRAALGAFLAQPPEPLVLVFDETERISAAHLSTIFELPTAPGVHIVVAGRSLDERALTAARLAGPVRFVGVDELRLGVAEAEQILLDLDADEIDDLVRVTDGWAAGLRLAASTAHRGTPGEGFTGRERIVVEYVRSRVLAELADDVADFVMRASLFEELEAGLCDAALARTGSQQILEALERSGHFLFAVDRRSRRFAWQRFVRAALEDECERRFPGEISAIRRRGADWLAHHDRPVEALRLRVADGARADALEVLGAAVLPMFYAGELTALVDLFHGIGADIATTDGYLATMFAYAGVMTGDYVCATRWGKVAADHYSRHPFKDSDEAVAYLTYRAHLAANGTSAMLEDALAARREVAESSPWRSPTLMIAGIALSLTGHPAEAAAALDEAIHLSREENASAALVLALAQRALLMETPNHSQPLVDEAMEVARDAKMTMYPQTALPTALAALAAARRGERERARELLTAAERYRPLVGKALPWLAVQLRIAIVRTAIRLGDIAVARGALREAEEMIALLPGRGPLAAEIRSVSDAVAGLSLGERTGPVAGANLLTTAEWRLLPLLPTHLTFEEIGGRLHLSKNTIKTQAISIYRKLGVSSRSEAVEAVRTLGLIEA